MYVCIYVCAAPSWKIVYAVFLGMLRQALSLSTAHTETGWTSEGVSLTDRQTGRQADRQTGRHTDRQTDRQAWGVITLMPGWCVVQSTAP